LYQQKKTIMPNWCDNSITIQGDKKVIKMLKNVINNLTPEDYLFENLVGKNPNFTISQNEENCNHNLERYGTKWDVQLEDANLDIESDDIFISVQTAWSPPEKFCYILCESYQVRVNITYSEAGVGFAGETTFDIDEDGEVSLVENCYDNYYEGMYYIEGFDFWEIMEQEIDCFYENNSSDDDDENLTFEKFLEDYNLGFLDEVQESKDELLTLFNEKIEEYESEI